MHSTLLRMLRDCVCVCVCVLQLPYYYPPEWEARYPPVEEIMIPPPESLRAPVRNRSSSFLRHFMLGALEIEHLPRQARDKHRKSCTKGCFLQVGMPPVAWMQCMGAYGEEGSWDDWKIYNLTQESDPVKGAGPNRAPELLVKAITRGYMMSVSYIDSQVGMILDALERAELADDTVVAIWGE
jgi:membrane-anchored protein YejM (alkaline phosphatase superfamily)